ncbi:hypothetical protein LTR27_011918 [Elasticomyces elasticus]|nr:hypothetical protein LTR27_011918 [Elasticomyces elasticus]
MYFRKDPKRYGEIIYWGDEMQAFEDMKSRREMLPGHGLMVLEIQERIYHFLVDCCRAILHDVPASEMTTDKYPMQCEPAINDDVTTGFASLSIMASEAPYRLPAKYDLTRLRSLFSARVAAAEENIWSLREDPSYFAECLEECKEHQTEKLQDTNDQIFSNRSTLGTALERFTMMYDQIVHLQKLHGEYESTLRVDRDLPEEYLKALLTLSYYLDKASEDVLMQLRFAILPSPPMRPYHARYAGDPRRPTWNELGAKPGVQLVGPQAELMQLLVLLWEDDDQLALTNQTIAVDELDRLLQAEPKARELISGFVASIISDLSILTEATRQLNTFRPWARSFDNQFENYRAEIEESHALQTVPLQLFVLLPDEAAGDQIVRLGNPTDRKFLYPVEKRRTADVVNSLRTAEHNLDAFWMAADEKIRANAVDEKKTIAAADRNLDAYWKAVDKWKRMNAGDGLKTTAVYRLLAQPRYLRRTPEWVEPIKTSSAAPCSTPVLDEVKMPLSELYFELEHRTESTPRDVRATEPSIAKVKKRVVGSSAAEDTEANLAPINTPAPQPTFAVDARALKVFRTLFYTPSISATPGEVPWIDFLHAMQIIGFMPEKLYGSVWQFQPIGLDVERSIQFHEPHPLSKLAYRNARRFGRRLERAYGWNGGMFELKAKA